MLLLNRDSILWVLGVPITAILSVSAIVIVILGLRCAEFDR